MAIGFPPIPTFPNAFDTDNTLFVVHNTSEAALSSDNHPWAEEGQIMALPIYQVSYFITTPFKKMEMARSSN
jgi:hypothetical protein